ncbi:hypothetical protein ACSBR1_037256 [Camellia fascicularis]
MFQVSCSQKYIFRCHCHICALIAGRRWIPFDQEAMEIMVARSAMALAKRKQSKGGDNQSLDSS